MNGSELSTVPSAKRAASEPRGAVLRLREFGRRENGDGAAVL